MVVHEGLKFEGHGCKPLGMSSMLEVSGRLMGDSGGNKGLNGVLVTL